MCAPTQNSFFSNEIKRSCVQVEEEQEREREGEREGERERGGG